MKSHHLRLAFLTMSALTLTDAVANADLLDSLRPDHPRLIASDSTWPQLREKRTTNAEFDAFLDRSEAEARQLLSAPPLTYDKIGRRLLTVSRAAVRRVLLLSLHHQLSGDQAFARRAEAEMLALAAFSDWNPSHFLDTAEMTAALGFGYDWLFDELSPSSRATIRQAIAEKGLQPALERDHGWLRANNNWNQVCLGGLTVGALAIAEDEPKLAEAILEKAKQFNSNGLKPYAPDGIYPEGPGYWSYGTSYQVVLLSVLESALGTTWDLEKAPGFLPSAQVMLQLTGPSSRYYNYADGGDRAGLEPALFWFADRTQQPKLIERQKALLSAYAASDKPASAITSSNRFLPLVALWWNKPQNEQPLELSDFWHGAGEQPLAVFRDDWNDPNTTMLAFKGGAASLNHAHMDAGSFIFESDGVRWALDLGAQDYNSLESKGVNLWDRSQNAERWKVYRVGPFSHNTLTIGGQLHNVKGHAKIERFSDGSNGQPVGASVDLTDVFKDQAAKVRRTFTFVPQKSARVRDKLEGVKAGEIVRWAMATKAKIELDGPTATLRENGKELRARLVAPAGARFEVEKAEPEPLGFNAPNPGTSLLLVRVPAPADGAIHIEVELSPE